MSYVYVCHMDVHVHVYVFVHPYLHLYVCIRMFYVDVCEPLRPLLQGP